MAVETVHVAGALDPLLDLVRERAGDIERAGRLPDDVVVALRATGIHRLAMPAALGGLQAPVLDMMAVVESIAAVDGSTAWCAVIGFGSNIFAGYLPEAGAQVVFADPDQGNATMFAPCGTLAGEGRHRRLTGRWPFASNCLHSTWIGLGAVADGDGAESIPRVAFVPMADLTVAHTWEAAGLRGTGSHHVSASDVEVDLAQSCRFSDRPWPEGTLWRMPLYTALIPLLSAVPLGIARGAVDEISRQAREGRDARRGQLADDPISMDELAVADVRLRGARAGLREAVDEVSAVAERGDRVSRSLQARTMLAALHACDVAVAVTSAAHLLGGGAAAYAGSPLLRALCDVEAARQHLLFSHQHRPRFGAAVAGLDVAYPPFVV
ncbi:MAG TPA: acyl-CoA dehydrogenase family protein [Acidimicrobiales bacterium]|nr:acyl-CoA dehydrogenase family protein [Acidimicrobiales bacterium]